MSDSRLLLCLGSGAPQFYIGVGPRNIGPVHSVTRFVQYIMANLTGTVTNLTETQCQNPESKDVSGSSIIYLI